LLISHSGLPKDTISEDPQSVGRIDTNVYNHVGLEQAKGNGNLAVPPMQEDKIESHTNLINYVGQA
jgi:hypothetical protein